MILALFAGIGDLFLVLTLKNPKENQCFQLRTLKNLRKINVFALPEHLVTLGASILDLKASWTSKVAFWVAKVAFRAPKVASDFKLPRQLKI